MISIVTLTYNNFEQLLATLGSLPKEKYVESIVINGGSCPKTKKYLDSYRGISVSETDSGIADAFNKGIHLARGDFITFLNSGDVLIDQGYYARAKEYFKSFKKISFVYADLNLLDPDVGYIKMQAQGEKIELVGRGIPFPHPTLIVKKDVFQEIGTFNLKYKIAMDYEWMLRLLKSNRSGIYMNCAPVLMDTTGVSASQPQLRHEEVLMSLKNHFLYEGKIKKDFDQSIVQWKNRQKIKCIIKKMFGSRGILIIKKIKYFFNLM